VRVVDIGGEEFEEAHGRLVAGPGGRAGRAGRGRGGCGRSACPGGRDAGRRRGGSAGGPPRQGGAARFLGPSCRGLCDRRRCDVHRWLSLGVRGLPLHSEVALSRRRRRLAPSSSGRRVRFRAHSTTSMQRSRAAVPGILAGDRSGSAGRAGNGVIGSRRAKT
jgi:hypothetical protein